MAKYVNKNFDRFLSEKDLKENILKENPVPLTKLKFYTTQVDRKLWLTRILKLFNEKSEMSWVQYAGYGQ